MKADPGSRLRPGFAGAPGFAAAATRVRGGGPGFAAAPAAAQLSAVSVSAR